MVKIGHPDWVVDAVTDQSRPAVIPPVIPARTVEVPAWNQRGALAARPPLPLLKLALKRVGTAVYGLSTLDTGGRISDKAIMTALGWKPHERLDIRVSRGLIAIFADNRGIFRVKARGFVSLPIAARRWSELGVGSRVLLAAYPEGGLLLVHPPVVLDEVVAQVFNEAWGADG